MSLDIKPRNYHPTAAVLSHDLSIMLSHHPEAFDCIIFPALDSSHNEIVAENSPTGTLLDREERLQAYDAPVKARAMIVPDEAQMISMLGAIGFDMAEFTRMYGCDAISDGIRYAKDLKDRYTVLWLFDRYHAPVRWA